VAPDAYSAAPDTAPGPGIEHCPHCRGAVRPGAPWCTQCWTDLRPAPAPAVPPAAPAVPAPATPVATGGPVSPRRSATAGWPCLACGEANPVEVDVCLACGTAFLAAMRAEEQPLLVLPGVGDVLRLSRVQRLGLGAAVALGVVLLVLAVGLLLG
jgi:hypothetical protein